MVDTFQLYSDSWICGGCSCRDMKQKWNTGVSLVNTSLYSLHMREHERSLRFRSGGCRTLNIRPSRRSLLIGKAVLGGNVPILNVAENILTKSSNALGFSPLVLNLAPAVCVVAFASWGVVPFVRLCSSAFIKNSDNTWKKSDLHFITSSLVRPVLLWTGVTLICRSLDPLVFPSATTQAVKQRVLNFVQSLTTVLSFAYCISSLTQLAQKFFVTNDSNDTGSMSFNFAGKAIYTAVWVASVSLFMELLGFSTQKWLTAGGFGTVLITLAGREIITNFLSSLMIHATRPFVLNEWIQTKIEGYEISGTVERVGWWSPTVIRGDDREAVHIPNHKFNVAVVRNLSQKTHWRIKTYIAISHLDVSKINIIVADMRKVIAKNPQIEQQKLHRRVFLENIDVDNQSLMILISCFVKTSRFEEYLCVKEGILLDLLRVVNHHRARLATPIRTMQKPHTDADFDADTETIFSGSRMTRSPYLLIEPSYKISDDKGKSSAKRGGDENDVGSGAETGKKGAQGEGGSRAHQMEDNIVLEVALEGSKRTLPMEEPEAETKAAPAQRPAS